MQTSVKLIQNYHNGLKWLLIIWLAAPRGQNCPTMSRQQHFNEKYGTVLELFLKGKQYIYIIVK